MCLVKAHLSLAFCTISIGVRYPRKLDHELVLILEKLRFLYYALIVSSTARKPNSCIFSVLYRIRSELYCTVPL